MDLPSDVAPPPNIETRAPRRDETQWWPLVLVATVLLVVVFGGYLFAAGLSRPTGPPVGFNGIVQLHPFSGWQVAGSGRGALELAGRPVSAPFVLLTRGNGNIALVAVPGADVSAEVLAAAYVEGALRARLHELSVSRELQRVALSAGATALRLTFVGVRTDTGASVEGEVTVLVLPSGDGVVFDAFSPAGLFRFIQGDVHGMEDETQLFA